MHVQFSKATELPAGCEEPTSFTSMKLGNKFDSYGEDKQLTDIKACSETLGSHVVGLAAPQGPVRSRVPSNLPPQGLQRGLLSRWSAKPPNVC